MHGKDWKSKQTHIGFVTAGRKCICLFLQQGQQLQQDRSYGLLMCHWPCSTHGGVCCWGEMDVAALCVTIKIVHLFLTCTILFRETCKNDAVLQNIYRNVGICIFKSLLSTKQNLNMHGKKIYLLTIKSLQGKYMGKHVGYEAAVRCSRGLTQEWEDLPSGPALPTTCRASLHIPDWSVLICFWGRACPFACRAMSIGQLCPLTCGSAGSLLHVAIS